MTYFLDTNIIIYAIKGKYPEIENHFRTIPSYAIKIPSIVMAEIEYGARKSYDYEKTIYLYQRFTSPFGIEPFSKKAQGIYGQVRSELETRGTPIGGNDMLIAATVLADNGILVTNNTKEFSRINGLKIEDWTQNGSFVL